MYSVKNIEKAAFLLNHKDFNLCLYTCKYENVSILAYCTLIYFILISLSFGIFNF